MVLPTEATEIFSSMMGCIFYAIVYIIYFLSNNIPFPSSLGPVYQKEVKWLALNMIFHSHAHANNSFSQERLRTWPHFETEGFWNSEVGYLSGIYVVRTSL